MTAVVASAAAAIPMVVSGTASAQTNSRLCGLIYETTPESPVHEIVIKLYEVEKEDRAFACDQAVEQDSNKALKSPFTLRQQDKNFWRVIRTLEEDKCEPFMWRPDSLQNRTIDYLVDFPAKDPKNICKDMNRSDTVFDMNPYWLYLDPADGKWDFTRPKK